jgi:hypothetical protein
MPTTFTKPDLPGTAVSFIGQTILNVPPGFQDTVAIMETADTGPIRTPAQFNSLAEFEAVYGRNASPARTAVVQAFAGGALDGQGGAGSVIFSRLAGTAAAVATASFTNTTPAAALSVSALYPGTAGNAISISVEDDPAQSSTGDLIRVLSNGAEVERYNYAQTDIAGLVASINALSRYITATSTITGVALTLTGTPTLLTGGNDGSTLLTADYVAGLSSLEYQEFGIITYSGIDSTVVAAYVAWVRTQIEQFRPVVLVIGGAAGENVTTAIARSTAVDTVVKPHVVNVGVGTYTDDLLGLTLSTAGIAARVAGILASRGEGQSLTYADLGSLHVVAGTGGTLSQLRQLRDNGVTSLRRVSGGQADLKISQGVTTFISKTEPTRPYAIFSEPRMVRVMDNFIREMRLWSDENIIGDTTVVDNTRAAVRGYAQKLLDALLDRGIILPGPKPYVRTPIVADVNLADSIPFEFGWMFARTTNFVIGNGLVR